MSNLTSVIRDNSQPDSGCSPEKSEQLLDTVPGLDAHSQQTLISTHSSSSSDTDSSDASFFAFGNDGAADLWRKRAEPNPTAIFLHAGAGYHSFVNEQIHLDACREAARAAMRQLKDGKSAIEAVEEAVRVLEDKEITNAGFGSNLTIDGTVECDATMVDHLGRSGACGAVPNIKNPVTLARTILEKSNEPLSLRRVPPNLLVGASATHFGVEHGIDPVHNERLISRNARDRFMRWQEDLKRADNSRASTPLHPIKTGRSASTVLSNETSGSALSQRDHASAILTGTWNEGQPDSPAHDSPRSNGTVAPSTSAQSGSPLPDSVTTKSWPLNAADRSPLNLLNSSPSPSRGSPTRSGPPPTKRLKSQTNTPNSKASSRAPRAPDPMDGLFEFDDGDDITDTVGAIAIDAQGNIAAASSSGGIGMKHKGRIGPAALVGIGTAVIPVHPGDVGSTTVATVTSGTGEHMATTMAAQKCAERLYQGTVRSPTGADVGESDEGAIVRAFITRDFLEHPGVQGSCSAPAIGVMAVKKTTRGYYLYFAHNTDSFALASMGSTDREPSCVMSRVPTGSKNSIAQGARKISIL